MFALEECADFSLIIVIIIGDGNAIGEPKYLLTVAP